MLELYRKIRNNYAIGEAFSSHPVKLEVNQAIVTEMAKKPLRYDVINYLLSCLGKNETNYLEIGVRNPEDNFNLIESSTKYSVDPGVEFEENPVDFNMTSDQFFEKLRAGKILNENIKFDVIFIDGLHLAEQVERDIYNALDFLDDNGFVVLHDCNPPSEWHARDNFSYGLTPAGLQWSGTTWKAFVAYREDNAHQACCIDSDWGIGVIHKKINFKPNGKVKNKFFEFSVFEQNKIKSLNLKSYDEFREIVDSYFHHK